jgi:hypothetical protein
LKTNNNKRRFSSVRIVYLLLASAFASGCAPLPTSPFQSFSESLVALKDGTDQVLGAIAPQAETRFKREAIAELETAYETGEAPDEPLIDTLLLESSGSPLAISAVPLFLKLDQFRLGASQTTGALVGYARLLQQLSSPDLLPAATFNQLATDLNSNAMQALNSMSSAPGQQAQANVALFSQAAIAALQAYLQSKRKEALAGALATNQKAVSDFAGLMQSAVNIMALAAQNEYNANFQDINKRALVAATRAKAIDELIALDRAYVAQVRTLQDLRDAFGKVPAAHEQLAAVVEGSGQSLSAVVSVLEAGKRLQASYGQAAAANRVASADAVAAAAAARADAREAQAETAALRAASANAEAVEARLAASADPHSQTKAANATALKEQASALAEEAERLRSEAVELRTAAGVVRQRADDIKDGAQSGSN